MKRFMIQTILIASTISALVILGTSCKKQNLEYLLSAGKTNDAIELCKDLEGDEQKKGYETIADYYYENNNYLRAAEFYAKAQIHVKAVNSYVFAKEITEAEKYCQNQSGEAQKQCASSLGVHFYLQGNYEKAISYYSIAGQTNEIEKITAKIPIFKLANTIRTASPNPTDRVAKRAIFDINETFHAFIYNTDTYRQWKNPKDSPVDAKAALILEDINTAINTWAAPEFLSKIEKIIAANDWSQKNLNTVTFERIALDRFIKLLKILNTLGKQRKFFNKYNIQTPTMDYDGIYEKSLNHVSMFLETSKSNRNATGETLKNAINDMDVDMEIIEYIAGMTDNIKSRILNLENTAKRISQKNNTPPVSKKTEDILSNFYIACNDVMTEIKKEDYPKANDLLLNSFRIAEIELGKYLQ